MERLRFHRNMELAVEVHTHLLENLPAGLIQDLERH